MALFKAVCELSDVVSLLLYCAEDSTIMLVSETSTNEFWIPSQKVLPGQSWEKAMNKDLTDIFGVIVPVTKLQRYNKLWIPNHKYPYLHHVVFQVVVTADQKKKSKTALGRFRGKVRWVNEEELKKFLTTNTLKSPEIVDLFNFAKNPNYKETSVPVEHYTINSFMEISEDLIVMGKSNIYEQIVDSSGIDRGAQEALYREFLLMCFPANFMVFQTFQKFALEIGWPKDEVQALFRSADVQCRGGISFREFLYFLAVVEPGTSHGGAPAEMRCRYIFRFFDYDKNGVLKADELKNFIICVRKSKKQPIDNAKVDKDLQDCYKVLGITDGRPLSLTEFLRSVGELKIRGTSQIYRSPISIQKYVKDILDRDARAKNAANAALTGAGPQKSTINPVASMKNLYYSKAGEYELAVHTIRIHKSGTTINVDQLWSLDTNAVTFSSTRQPILNEMVRRLSMDQFSQSSTSNELLKALRYLTTVNKRLQTYTRTDIPFNWGQLDPAIMAKHLINVCAQVKEILMKEPRLLDLTSPVYIMGDLHGNFPDLLFFERVLWHVGPGLCPCNLLFLGDYVDRGAFSVEVIAYLFSYKLQSPRKLRMLRGNHEIKRVQIQWTFEKECKLKFGDKLGLTVFNAINEAFDTMPLAAVIDGRVFCCHGGIPPPWLCPVATAINDIPVVLNEPQDQSSLAWELMWNDPVRSKHVTEKVAMELLANEGFATNTKRGTAHIFSVEALEKFLQSNGFTHIVRAHEVVESGFNIQQKGKLLTVFSSSKYCGGSNEAACILADQGKLRILRMEMNVNPD